MNLPFTSTHKKTHVILIVICIAPQFFELRVKGGSVGQNEYNQCFLYANVRTTYVLRPAVLHRHIQQYKPHVSETFRRWRWKPHTWFVITAFHSSGTHTVQFQRHVKQATSMMFGVVDEKISNHSPYQIRQHHVRLPFFVAATKKMGQWLCKQLPCYARCDCCNVYQRKIFTFSHNQFTYCEHCVPPSCFTKSEDESPPPRVIGRYFVD